MCSKFNIEDQLDICMECGKCVIVTAEDNESEICSP